MNKKLVINFIILIIGILIKNGYSQSYYASYDTLDIFSKFTKPYRIAIFNPLKECSFEEEFFEDIYKQNNIVENYTFYPNETLLSFKSIPEIESLNSSNVGFLNKLKNKFDIDLLMEVKTFNESENNIILIDTQNGQVLFNNNYILTKNSTPIKDLVILFSEYKKTVYKTTVTSLPDMIFVEKGEIIIPKSRYQNDTIIVNQSFYKSKYECTVKQFEEFIISTGYKTTSEIDGSSFYYKSDNQIIKIPGPSWKYDENQNLRTYSDYSEYPVIYVSWYDAMQYCEWLSDKTGEKFRLPSFNEWKFAAYRGENNELSIFSGDNTLDSLGWFKENSNLSLHKVGRKKPNKLGLYVMSGNVREWCLE